MLTLETKTLSKSSTYKKAVSAIQLNQTGIINITKENQKELTKYFNIQTNSQTGYAKIDLNKPINVGEVDMAKYGETYYDVLDKSGNKYKIDYEKNLVYEKKENSLVLITGAKYNDNQIITKDGTNIKIDLALKEGISVMIQKNGYDKLGNALKNSEFDIYPNPNPYAQYTTVEEMKQKDTTIKDKKYEVLTGISLIDDSIKMYMRTDRSTLLLKVEDLVEELGVLFITEETEQLIKAGGYIAVETDKLGQKFLSHGINPDVNGNPIGYSLEKPKELTSLDLLNESSKVLDDQNKFINKLKIEKDELKKELEKALLELEEYKKNYGIKDVL